VYSEAIANPDLQDTQFATQVKNGGGNLTGLYWAVADAVDLQTALYVGAVAPALGCIACVMLPRPAPTAPSPQPAPAPAGIV